MLGFYNYTVILTYLGMLTGFVGIPCASSGNIRGALICLVIAGVCDMFDGKIASTMVRTRQEKRFGVQIDSLSDLICFGVLPAMIVFTVSRGHLRLAIPALYTLCALIRLAWFNVDEQERQDQEAGRRKVYLGLPVTSAALILPVLTTLGMRCRWPLQILLPLALLLTAAAFLTPFQLRKPALPGMIKQTLNPKNWLPHAVALSLAVVIYVVLTNFSSVWDGMRTFFGYFSPVLLGCVIAYLVNPLAKLLQRSVFRKVKNERPRKFFSNALAFVAVLAVIALLMAILIPQLIEGVSTFTSNLDSYLESLRIAFPGLNKSFGKYLNNPDVLASREKLLSTVAAAIRNNADSLLEASALAGKSLIQWLIGLFLSVYLLSEKDSLKAGFKRMLRALLPEPRYEGLRTFLLRCDTILNRYVVYNLLDSLIIGGANAIFMAVMGIPYVGLVSFIVSVTNLIPTFGPMIGGAVGALLLCLVKLRYAVIFLIFTAIVQLCDAYIVKPKLFGNSLGVSSLWILIGIIVGGRMFGAIGVLLAIPAVAILDFLYTDYILPRLEARK